MKTACQLAFVIAGVFLAGIAFAAPVVATAPQSGACVESASVVVDPAAAAKIKTSVNRSVMINSMIAHPTGRAALAQEAARWGITDDDLGRLGPKALQKIPAAEGQLSPADSYYSMLDWGTGITFTHLYSPKYSVYHLGATTLSEAIVNSYNDTAIISTRRYNPSFQTGQAAHLVMRLQIEMPMHPLTYQVALKLTDKDGNAPATWLDSASGLKPPISLQAVYWDAQGQVRQATGGLTAPLSTGNGYAGIFGINPTGYYKAPANGPSDQPVVLRRYNCEFRLFISKDSATPAAVDNLLYGGITVSML